MKKTQYRLFPLILLLSLFSSPLLVGQKFNALTFSQLPQDYQLYPRESDNMGTIAIEGTISSNEFQSYSVRLLRNGQIKSYKKSTLPFSNGTAKLAESLKIPAELAEYGVEIYGFKNADSTLIV
ncbi:MAG: hypothetical protein AABZ56_01550, partial [Bacteroidota bacterium]